MHPAYFSASASKRSDELEVGQPEGEQPEIVALGEVVDAFGDPPPHAANPSPTAASTAASAARRQR
jgi:hypothetical protein